MNLEPIRSASASHHRGEGTRRRILEAAIELFAQEGYDRASTRRLADAARVNLPAIQYYFGSKEGLYQAAIEHIREDVERRLAPAAAEAAATLAAGEARRPELLRLLWGVLDAFLLVVIGDERLASQKLFLARADIERSAAVDRIHEVVRRNVVEPCAMIIGRLLGRPPEDEAVLLRAVAIIGQISVFCHRGAVRLLGSSDRSCAVQAILREHTEAALLHAAAAGRES